MVYPSRSTIDLGYINYLCRARSLFAQSTPKASEGGHLFRKLAKWHRRFCQPRKQRYAPGVAYHLSPFVAQNVSINRRRHAHNLTCGKRDGLNVHDPCSRQQFEDASLTIFFAFRGADRSSTGHWMAKEQAREQGVEVCCTYVNTREPAVLAAALLPVHLGPPPSTFPSLRWLC